MSGSIFSTYKAGENRVTASILAVLKSLSLGRIERLLGALMEESEFELVRFQNQPSKGGVSVPDAEIAGSCRILVETKTARNAVRKDQLANHLKHLDGVGEAVRRLLVVTPDNSRPSAIESLADNRLVWTSFAALDQAIDELLADKSEVISEREAFLLRELQAMLAAEGLTGSATEIVIVPARHAWPEYKDFHAYVCQPQRRFRPVKWMGFYSHGQLHPLVPVILEVHDSVLMEHGRHGGRLGELVEQLLDRGLRKEGESN